MSLDKLVLTDEYGENPINVDVGEMQIREDLTGPKDNIRTYSYHGITVVDTVRIWEQIPQPISVMYGNLQLIEQQVNKMQEGTSEEVIIKINNYIDKYNSQLDRLKKMIEKTEEINSLVTRNETFYTIDLSTEFAELYGMLESLPSLEPMSKDDQIDEEGFNELADKFKMILEYNSLFVSSIQDDLKRVGVNTRDHLSDQDRSSAYDAHLYRALTGKAPYSVKNFQSFEGGKGIALHVGDTHLLVATDSGDKANIDPMDYLNKIDERAEAFGQDPSFRNYELLEAAIDAPKFIEKAYGLEVEHNFSDMQGLFDHIRKHFYNVNMPEQGQDVDLQIVPLRDYISKLRPGE